MKAKRFVVIGVAAIAVAVPMVIALASTDDREETSTGLVREVREATRDFQSVKKAMDAGYSSSGSCVSGPQEGAMGVHFPNGALIADGRLDAKHPEILIYEQRGGRLRLVGVEFLVLAQQWDASNPGPPVLMGQHFQYVGSPNRYRLPAFYEMHVWAWKDNPSGAFVDWNPAVSCEEYVGDGATHASVHGMEHTETGH
jgi:hypothetical protein